MAHLANGMLFAALFVLLAQQPATGGAIEGQVRGTGPAVDLSNFVMSVEDI